MENPEQQLRERNLIQRMLAEQLEISLEEFVERGCAAKFDRFLRELQEQIRPTTTIGMAKALGREVMKAFKPYEEEPDEITNYYE